MPISSNRQVLVFNQRGDEAATMAIPDLIYLQTEKQYIEKALRMSRLQGMAILIDWDTREVTMVRYNE